MVFSKSFENYIFIAKTSFLDALFVHLSIIYIFRWIPYRTPCTNEKNHLIHRLFITRKEQLIIAQSERKFSNNNKTRSTSKKRQVWTGYENEWECNWRSLTSLHTDSQLTPISILTHLPYSLESNCVPTTMKHKKIQKYTINLKITHKIQSNLWNNVRN